MSTGSAGRTLKIQVEGGPVFEVATGDDSLLRGALRSGFDFPYECSVGGCGSCRFDLLDGTVTTLWAQAPGLSERDRKRGKRLACQSRPDGDCTIRVRPAGSEPSGLPAPRRVEVPLVARRRITPDLDEFTFRVPAAMRFRAGQYALLYLPGVHGARAYSMSNLPGDTGSGSGSGSDTGSDSDSVLWRFMVRQVPGGQGSGTLFTQVQLGDTIGLDGPYGHAWLRPGVSGGSPARRDVVCIAGGSGLGPMLSVVRGALAEDHAPRRLHVFLGLRTQAELGAEAELLALGHDPRLHLTTVLSAPTPTPAWSGPTGWVHTEVERGLPAPLDRFDFYFAGPPPMIEALQELLMVQHRVPFAQIHFDRFV